VPLPIAPLPTVLQGAPGNDATPAEQISYIMEQLAHQQQLNAHFQQQFAHQQQQNAWVHAKFHAVEWGISEIHHKFNMREVMDKEYEEDKFNMREAMDEYEEGIFHLLEFSDGWCADSSGIPPPGRLADIAYLHQKKHAKKWLQVSKYLTQFDSFLEYFDSLDALLDAMRQWSTAFKEPKFSHDDHPQPKEMAEMLMKIGQQMTALKLVKLHVEVMEKKFPGYTHLVFHSPAKNHTNYPPTATHQPSGSEVSKD
jgi:hypothetical protein